MNSSKDFFSGLFFLFIAILIWFLIPYQIQTTNSKMFNGQFFPKIISLILGISSILEIILSRKKRGGKDPILVKEELKVFILFILLLSFVYLFSLIGFLFTSLIYGPLILLFFRQKRISYYCVVELVAISVYLIFTYFLDVQLG